MSISKSTGFRSANAGFNRTMEHQDDVQMVWLDPRADDTDKSVLTKSNFLRSIVTEYIILIVSPDFFAMVIAVCIFSIDREISDSSIMHENESKITFIPNQKCLKEVILRHIRHMDKQALNMTLLDQLKKSTKDLSIMF